MVEKRLLSVLVFLGTLYVISISAALPALAQVSQPATPAFPAVQVMQRVIPWRDPSAITPAGSDTPSSAHLSYFGGPVISNARIVEVLYGSGSYLPQVFSTTAPSIASFFSDILGTSSGYINLLTQYNTPASGGTNQTIGNGTFDGLFQIFPSDANNGFTIDDSQIQAELLDQIIAGHLPAPALDAAGNVNTLYMIYFPPGKTITLGNASSCVGPNGFCAYHGTTSNTLNAKNILYGVMPDMQAGSGCFSGCGPSSVFGNYTSVTSHELTEAITDADAGLTPFAAFPRAWVDPVNSEIGDICNQLQGAYTANGTTYTIQLEFSNAANRCVLPTNFALSASPASLTFAQDRSASTTITVTPANSFAGSVSLSASGLPAGVTASFNTNPTTSTSALTLTASVAATAGPATVLVTGTSGTLTQSTTFPLNIIALASPTSGAAPLTVSFFGGSRGTLPLDHWDFGDGQTSLSQNSLVHTYQTAGTFTATPFYRSVEITRTVPPHTRVTLLAGSPVTISVF